jgi:hypothetical protein
LADDGIARTGSGPLGLVDLMCWYLYLSDSRCRFNSTLIRPSSPDMKQSSPHLEGGGSATVGALVSDITGAQATGPGYEQLLLTFKHLEHVGRFWSHRFFCFRQPSQPALDRVMVLLRFAGGGAVSTSEPSLSLDALADESDIIVQQQSNHDRPTSRRGTYGIFLRIMIIAYQARN